MNTYKLLFYMVCLAGVDPATYGTEIQHSIQLSYGRAFRL